MTDARRTGLQVKRSQGVVQIDIDADRYVPKRTFYVDYANVHRGADGVRLVFGKRDPFAVGTAQKLHYALEVSFPNAQFCNQLYKSLVTPTDPTKPLFVDS